MAKKKPQHGGSRPGAGRKPISESGSTLIGASLPVDLVEQLDAVATKNGWTRAEAVREAVKMLLRTA